MNFFKKVICFAAGAFLGLWAFAEFSDGEYGFGFILALIALGLLGKVFSREGGQAAEEAPPPQYQQQPYQQPEHDTGAAIAGAMDKLAYHRDKHAFKREIRARQHELDMLKAQQYGRGMFGSMDAVDRVNDQLAGMEIRRLERELREMKRQYRRM